MLPQNCIQVYFLYLIHALGTINTICDLKQVKQLYIKSIAYTMAQLLSASLPISDPSRAHHKSSIDRMSHSFTSPRHGPSCWCCPYGYHIDLDFVRYCEVLTQEPKEPGASQSQRQRRDRRRQRRSMEVMLGFEQIAELQQAQQVQSPLYEVDEFNI